MNGLSSLQFLTHLDLSNNALSVVKGLDNLPIRELFLQGNALTNVDLTVGRLPKLTNIDLSDNMIVSLAGLQPCTALQTVRARNNELQNVYMY